MLKRTPINRSSKPLKSKTKLKSSTKLKPGKKTKDWSNLRKVLYEELAEKGITSCELQYENCTGRVFPSLAHSKKRRFIESDLEMREVIFACVGCHEKIEYLPKEEMYEIVIGIIKSRNNNGYP